MSGNCQLVQQKAKWAHLTSSSWPVDWHQLKAVMGFSKR